MRRTGLALLVLLAACSSGGSSGHPSSGSSTAPSTTTARSTSTSTSTTTPVDPSVLSDLDRAGATAFLTLFADGLRRRDPTLTPEQVACIPPAVLDRLTPQQLFTAVDKGLGALAPADAAKIGDALRSCHLTDEQVTAAHLG